MAYSTVPNWKLLIAVQAFALGEFELRMLPVQLAQIAPSLQLRAVSDSCESFHPVPMVNIPVARQFSMYLPSLP